MVIATVEDETVRSRFAGERGSYSIAWTELLSLEEDPIVLEDLHDDVQVLAPYYKGSGTSIFQGKATVASNKGTRG